MLKYDKQFDESSTLSQYWEFCPILTMFEANVVIDELYESLWHNSEIK